MAAAGVCRRAAEWAAARLADFEARDAAYPGREAEPTLRLLPLDGSSCVARTRDGVASAGSACVDLGVGADEEAGQDARLGGWHLKYLPEPHHLRRPLPLEMAARASQLHQLLTLQQFPLSCDSHLDTRQTYYVHTVPLVGFGSVIEYSVMFLARASHMHAQLVLGPTVHLQSTEPAPVADLWDWSCSLHNSGGDFLRSPRLRGLLSGHAVPNAR